MIRAGLLGVLAVGAAVPAAAQTAIDRVNPARIERENLPPPAKAVEPAPILERPQIAPTVTVPGAIEVGAIVFDGLRGLAPADFADIIARYIGRTVDGRELEQLAEEIASRARGRGYVFASARIEAQRLTAGVLTVRYDPGTLDEVRLVGSENRAVRAALAPLVGRPARMDEVERRLLIAGDIDGVSLRRSEYVREGSQGILRVTIVESRLAVRAVLENDSTAPIGPEQLRVDATVNRVLAADDAVTLTYVTTPFEPDEMQYIRGRYSRRVSRGGTEISLSAAASWTNPGDYLSSLDIHGESRSASVAVLQPLRRRRDGSLWFTGSFDLREVGQWRGDSRRRLDTILALRLGVYGNAKLQGGLLRGNFTVSRGLDGFGATRRGNPLASRDDASGTFTHAVAWADWTRSLGSGFSIRTAGQAQLASGPLLVAEEIGIGGNAFLRGYDYSERSGDRGYMGMAELRYDWMRPFGFSRKVQLYGFVDGGEVTNFRGGYGGGGLASGGGGVRVDVSSTIDANFEVGVPLTEPRYETGNHDPRLTFRLLKLF